MSANRNTMHRATIALDTIRTHWTASERPPRAGSVAGHAPPRSKPPAPQAVLRADIVTTLAYWVHALADEHPDTLDGYDEAHPLRLDDPTDTALHLRDNLDLIDKWGFLARFTTEVTQLANHLRELVDPPNRDRPKLGECHLLEDGQVPTESKEHRAAPRCRGDVRAVPQRNPRTGATTYGEARCSGCRTVAVIEWWRRQWGDGARLVKTAELVEKLAAQGIRTTPATVRWWLHAGRIVSSGTDSNGDRLWDVAAVVMALSIHERKRRGGTVGDAGTRAPETQPAQVSR